LKTIQILHKLYTYKTKNTRFKKKCYFGLSTLATNANLLLIDGVICARISRELV